jgi:hypothetical protein
LVTFAIFALVGIALIDNWNVFNPLLLLIVVKTFSQHTVEPCPFGGNWFSPIAKWESQPPVID